MKRYIAMIPARLGSKRIPKKNIRFMNDKPLIQYSIELSKQCKAFDEVWVTTESCELGRIVQNMGAKFHERPVELATDSATNRDFTYDFLKTHECDYVVMVNTTSPLLRQETVDNFMAFLENNDFDTVLSVISTKEETFFEDKPLNFSLAEKINSQFLPSVKQVVWALTAWKRSSFITLQESGVNPVFGGKVGLFSIPKDEACDLDTEEDWRIAEGILVARKFNQEKRYLEL